MIKEYNLGGKVAIVTGAGRGIGKRIALTLAEAGVDITVAARTREQIEATASEIRQLGRKALVVPTDVIKQGQLCNLSGSCCWVYYGRSEPYLTNEYETRNLSAGNLPTDV
jgi:7-alpha-hydroxysteroid dehydrogenase